MYAMLALTSKINKFIILLRFFLIVICVDSVSSGANQWHFHDGTSPSDIIAGDVFFEIIEPAELRYSYRVRPAKDFGAPFNQSYIFEKAHLVPTIPSHSCSDIKNYEDLVGQIALSERGVCSFVYKTAKAQEAGARAIIITESMEKWEETADHLIEMVDDKTDLNVNIPAAFLLGRNGVTILRTLKKLHKPYAIVNLPVNMTYIPISKMNQPPWITWASIGTSKILKEVYEKKSLGMCKLNQPKTSDFEALRSLSLNHVTLHGIYTVDYLI